MGPTIAQIEVLPLSIPRETPYLGPLESGVEPTSGYFIRPGNQTIYPLNDQSVLVKVTATDGTVGWGETNTFIAPPVTVELINSVIAPLVLGRDPHDVIRIYDELYNAMRVRGFFGGYWVDAIAALDMALWDLRARLLNLPLAKLLGGQYRRELPAYVSGLPGTTRSERVALARHWIERGFDAVKFAAAVANEGEEAEMQALREALGPGPKILIDFHWRYTDQEAIQIISRLEPYGLALAEAPVAPEDITGQANVVRAVKTPVGIGEELRTIYEFRPRFEQRCMSVVQPEMARTGVSAFVQICRMAQAFHCRVMPHASIGIGIYQAASLQVAATLPHLVYHEYQHSIFDRNLQFLHGNMACAAGFFTLPDGPGLGVTPNLEALAPYLLH